MDKVQTSLRTEIPGCSAQATENPSKKNEDLSGKTSSLPLLESFSGSL
jgi:hypothetical protein